MINIKKNKIILFVILLIIVVGIFLLIQSNSDKVTIRGIVVGHKEKPNCNPVNKDCYSYLTVNDIQINLKYIKYVDKKVKIIGYKENANDCPGNMQCLTTPSIKIESIKIIK